MNRCIAKPPKPQAPDFKAAATRAESTETSITCPFHTAWPQSGHCPQRYRGAKPWKAACIDAAAESREPELEVLYRLDRKSWRDPYDSQRRRELRKSTPNTMSASLSFKSVTTTSGLRTIRALISSLAKR